MAAVMFSCYVAASANDECITEFEEEEDEKVEE